jgi:hypothetical protein
MSVRDLRSLFEILTVKRTDLEGDDKSTIVAYLEQLAAAAGDPLDPQDCDESSPVDWWQHYGFISRPPVGAEAFIARVGANAIALASRAIAALGVFGKMSDGDVALYSIGGNVIRLNANGSVSVLVKTANGKQWVARIDPKGGGSLKVLNGSGMAIEFSDEQGFVLNAGSKDITLACGTFQVLAGQANMNVGSIKLHAAAAKPMVAGANTAPSVFI